jgi:L-iditol 2-dehydrogenase
MKQAMLVDEKRIEVREVPEPVPGPGDVLIQVKRSGICGSDLHTYKGENPLLKPPLVMGHEFSGIVADVGKGVEERKVGDRVAIYPLVQCGACSYCEEGKPALCPDLRFMGGLGLNGGHTEYLVVPEEKVVPIPDRMSLEEGALIEPTAVALHATDLAVLKPGERTLVIGAGTIGILHAQVARWFKAGEIIVASRSEHKLKLARELGADSTINVSEEDPVEWLSKTCGPQSVNCVFDYVANQESLDLAMQVVRSSGTIVVIGLAVEKTTISLFDLLLREIRLIGSSCYSIMEFHRVIQAWKENLLKLEPLVCGKYPLEKADEAFQEAAFGESKPTKMMFTM